MSWSVSASGDAKEAREKLAKDLEAITYLTGPEKEIKESTAKLIDQVLTGYEGTDVIVSANGHAGINGEKKYQNLNITIHP